jgi:DNA polymerase III subunit alpha
VIERAVANTARVAEKVEDYDILGRYQMPRFPIPDGHTPVSYLREVSEQGLRVRLGLAEGAAFDATYGERLDFELQVMEQMGFPTYFLVVWDYIRFARDNGIPVGPGRGSAAGSLVAYALGITNIDPVTNGLLFERFLNPERKSMPDIDTDFCIERRGEVIDYVTRRYGEDKVAQIITFNRMTSKAVLKDVARVLDIPYGDADRLAKLIPVVRGKPAKLKEMIGEESPAPEFREKYQNDPQVKRWVDMAMRIEGTNKTFGVHAAGVVIAADPLDEVVPLQRNNDGQVITQYFMEDVESMGLLKMDFLGLKNLTMIDKTIDLVKQSTGEQVDPDALPLDDPGTYGLLARGDLEGIFQLESSGMRQIVRDLKPSSLEDISSILALYRPGPLDAGLIPKFINRKHGREAIDFAHEKLQPILKETYGIMVYQEQIMKIAQDLAGYSLGEADLLRRAMGKKKKSEMEKHQSIFVKGATERGVDSKLAEGLFEQMVLFAEYCFNKSHSTAYGAVTYQTAYLKAHYPVAYMAALLTVNAGDSAKVQRYIANCNAMGIEVMPPDVNASGIDFTPVGDRILFGLSAVRNLGEGAIRQLIEVRQADGPFASLADLCDRIPGQQLNRRALEALIHSGALDALEPKANRAQLMADLDLVLDWASSRAKDRASGQGNLLDLLGGLGAAPESGDAGASGGAGSLAPPQGGPRARLPTHREAAARKGAGGLLPLRSPAQAAGPEGETALACGARQPGGAGRQGQGECGGDGAGTAPGHHPQGRSHGGAAAGGSHRQLRGGGLSQELRPPCRPPDGGCAAAGVGVGGSPRRPGTADRGRLPLDRRSATADGGAPGRAGRRHRHSASSAGMPAPAPPGPGRGRRSGACGCPGPPRRADPLCATGQSILCRQSPGRDRHIGISRVPGPGELPLAGCLTCWLPELLAP